MVYCLSPDLQRITLLRLSHHFIVIKVKTDFNMIVILMMYLKRKVGMRKKLNRGKKITKSLLGRTNFRVLTQKPNIFCWEN